MKVTLRRLEADDFAQTHAWRTSREVAKWMVNDSPIPWEDHDRWFAESSIDGSTRVRIVSCGNVECGVLSWTCESESTFSFGIYVVPSLSPVKKVGTAALFILLRDLFENEDAQVVRAEVLVNNHRAVKVYESLGFSRVLGSERQVLRLDGMSEILEVRIYGETWKANAPKAAKELVDRGLIDERHE